MTVLWLCVASGVASGVDAQAPLPPADAVEDPAPARGAAIDVEDATAQELLPIQSTLAFVSVAALASGGAATLAGLWVAINTSTLAHLDGKLRSPPLSIYFRPQASMTTALTAAMFSAALALPSMVVALASVLAGALTHVLATVDGRGRTVRKLAVRSGTAAVLASASLLPAVHVLCALVLLVPLAAAWAVTEVYPWPALSQATSGALPYFGLATASLHALTFLLLPAVLAAVALTSIGALLFLS